MSILQGGLATGIPILIGLTGLAATFLLGQQEGPGAWADRVEKHLESDHAFEKAETYLVVDSAFVHVEDHPVGFKLGQQFSRSPPNGYTRVNLRWLGDEPVDPNALREQMNLTTKAMSSERFERVEAEFLGQEHDASGNRVYPVRFSSVDEGAIRWYLHKLANRIGGKPSTSG